MGNENRGDKIKDLTQLISAKRVKMSVDGKLSKQSGGSAQSSSPAAKKSAAPKSAPQKSSGKPAAAGRPARPMRMHRPVKDFSKDDVYVKRTVDPMDEVDPSKLRERVKDEVKKILEKKKGIFTGKIKIGFEASKIVDIDVAKVEVDEDLEEKLIGKDKFDNIIKYLENPDPRNKEMTEITKGIPLDKIKKAKELGADSIIKKAKVKLDGTVQYTIIASVNQ